MAFEDILNDLAGRIIEYKDTIQTEEATKTAIVLPFISQVLGYDVFNPSEVIPEYVCDVGMKKGEKVDFAISRNGDIQMLIEMKKLGEELTLQHASQLIRYFSTSKARIGVLTNGQKWLFYTDLERPNIMDDTPFLQLDLLAIDPNIIPELMKMTKGSFDLGSVLASAEELKYVGEIKRVLGDMLSDPREDLVKLIISKVYEGRSTPAVRDLFTKLTTKAAAQFINDRVNDRLKTALKSGTPKPENEPSEEEQPDSPELEDASTSIETTLDEHEGFNIVRAIVALDIPYSRVFMRDAKSYCAILVDDNNRKPLCRLHFNHSRKYLGLFDEDKNEQRMPLDNVEDIYKYTLELRETAGLYV